MKHSMTRVPLALYCKLSSSVMYVYVTGAAKGAGA